MCRAIVIGGAVIRIFIFALTLSGLAVSPLQADDIQFHQPSTTSSPETLFDLDASHLNREIEQALIDHTGFANLREFAVHWDRPTFRCLVKSYELYEVQHGVCLVEIGAFQVAATALIIKGDKQDAFQVSILSAAIE